MCYLGMRHRHGEAVPEKISYSGGFGLLEIERDRFQGLDTEEGFEFSLQGFDYMGGNMDIEVNADIRSGGYIKGGLVKEGTLEYVKGFGLEDCIPLTGNGTQLKFQWGGKSKPCYEETRQRVEIRLQLKRCTLFSVSSDCR